MKIVNGAVVGLGYWGPNLVRNFLKIPYVKITSVCDISEDVLKHFSLEYPYIKTTTSLNDIISNPEIDFVAVATPLSTHFSIAKKILLSKKNVLIEKPITSNSKQARELIKISKRVNKIIMVGHTFVYSESVKSIKKIISNKTFGKMLYLDSTRINLGRFRSDTSVVWDLASHDFSILNFLLKEKPLSIQATGSSYYSKDKIEIANIFITYENNITVNIKVSWLSPIKIRNIIIGGSKKMIKYDDIEPSEKLKIYNKNISFLPGDITPFSPAYRSGNIILPNIKIKEPLLTELEHFVSCIKKGTNPLTDAKDGLRVVRLLEIVDKSLKTGKIITFHDK